MPDRELVVKLPDRKRHLASLETKGKDPALRTLAGAERDFLAKLKASSFEDRLAQRLHDVLQLSDNALLASLADATVAIRHEEARQQLLIRHLRTRGVPWARIGDALGLTRQGAWQRYGYLESDET